MRRVGVETLVAANTIAKIGDGSWWPTTYRRPGHGDGRHDDLRRHNQMVSGDRAYMEADGRWSSSPSPGADDDLRHGVQLHGHDADVDVHRRQCRGYAGDAMIQHRGRTMATGGPGFAGQRHRRPARPGRIVGNVRIVSTTQRRREAWAMGNLEWAVRLRSNRWGGPWAIQTASRTL